MSDVKEAAKIKAQTAYDAASDHYENEALGFWERYGRQTVERLGLEQGATVLDIGCGSGASALPAAAKVAPKGHVIGVDLSEKLLDIARAKAAKRLLGNVEFRLGDMERLGFPDQHFDAVVSVFSIFLCRTWKSRWLNCGAWWVRAGSLPLRRGGRISGSPCMGDGRKRFGARPDLFSTFHLWDRIATPERLSQLLIDGEVKDAEVVAESGLQPLQSPGDWWAIVLGSGLRWTADQLGTELAAQVRDDNVK